MAPLKSIRNVFVGALAGLSLLLLLLTAREVVKDVAALDVAAATPWIPPANGGWVHASEAPRRATGEPRQDYSCRIIHWQLSALPPLFCSTGGYDYCPESAQCSGEEFGVPRNFSVHFHEASSEPRAVAERYLAEADVVVFAYPIIEAHKSADDPTPLQHQTSTLVAMESGGYRPYLRQPSTFARFDYTFGFRTDLGPAIFTHDFSYIRNDPALTFGATPAPFGSGPKMSASDERTALAVRYVVVVVVVVVVVAAVAVAVAAVAVAAAAAAAAAAAVITRPNPPLHHYHPAQSQQPRDLIGGAI